MKTVFDDSDNVVSDDGYYDMFVQNGLVLVSTGSFDPFHEGHYNSIRLAYEEAISNGLKVSGIIVGTDHDSYVSKKNAHRVSFNWKQRIEYIEEFLKTKPGFDCPVLVDSWMAEHCSRDILFTTYLKHIKSQLPSLSNVAYICSNEYVDEVDHFEHDGCIFIVQRSIEHPLVIPKQIKTYGNKDNIHFVPNPVKDIASSKLTYEEGRVYRPDNQLHQVYTISNNSMFTLSLSELKEYNHSLKLMNIAREQHNQLAHFLHLKTKLRLENAIIKR